MLRPFTVLLLAAPAMLVAQQPDANSKEEKKFPAIGLLPDGSELKGVMLPRYDEAHNLIGVLKANVITLDNKEQISGAAVSIEFFNPDHSSRGRLDMKSAHFNKLKGLVRADEPVDMKFGRMSAHGKGLRYSFQDSQGYLIGPATTILQPLPKTAMNFPSSPLRATALLGMALLTQSLMAESVPIIATPLPIVEESSSDPAALPPILTPDQRSALESDAASMSTEASEANATVRSNLQDSVAASDGALQSAKTFLVQADLPVPAGADQAPVPAPLDVKPGPEDTVINCDGGMYFNAEQGFLVYMKNVRVSDPRFDLEGADELKVFFEKKPAKDPAEKADAAPVKEPDSKKGPAGFGKGMNLGDVERIVATGAVLVTQKNPGDKKEPVKASGGLFSYNVKSGDIILSGRYPWVQQGTMYQRAKEPNLTLRIDKNSNVVTEGRWEMGGMLNQKK